MKLLLLLAGLMTSFVAAADNIIVNGTRFIYPAAESEVTIQMSNLAARPAIAQIWMDEGDASALPDNITTPFQITPPISRIDAKGGQTLRIKLIDKKGIAEDRESLWWLNILDIPPIDKEAVAANKNLLQLAIRSRFKFFYRPEGLGNRDIAHEQLKFTAGGNKIVVNNPSPFYITITEIALPNKTRANEKSFMVSPKSTYDLVTKQQIKRGDKITIKNISDYGSEIMSDATLE